jgi:hypothetical protein
MKILEANYKNVDYILEDDNTRLIALYSVDWNGEIYTKGYYINLDQANSEYININDRDETYFRYRPLYVKINEEYVITNFKEI